MNFANLLRLRTLGICLAIAFTFASPAFAASEKVLYAFTGGADGANPVASLILDQSGNLYGTTANGGDYGAGTVFMLKPSLSGASETVLYSFTGSIDGGYPLAGLVFDQAGNLYGTAAEGGAYSGGVAFELSPPDGTWRETVLYSFNAWIYDGAWPSSQLTFDNSGNLYGTTVAGGGTGTGSAFMLAPSSGGWIEKETGNILGGPWAGLAFAGNDQVFGQFYGTTAHAGLGSIYTIVPGSGFLQNYNLYYFTGTPDGAVPGYGTLLIRKGAFYGTTELGGVNGYGTVFRYTNAPPTESVIYNFAGGNDGAFPLSGLISDRKGNFYGTTTAGGAFGLGTVFELSPNPDGSWTETVLHSFSGGKDGASPIAGLVIDSQGHLFGTTQYGGKNNAGVVFELQL